MPTANEDRHRFLRAFGLGFCQSGNHATERAYEYESATYCPEHPPPPGPTDAPVHGICQWRKGHYSSAIYRVPLDGRYYCREHLLRILAIGWWKP
jgi:hypothetical protein